MGQDNFILGVRWGDLLLLITMEFKNLRRYSATVRPARFPKAYRFVTPGRLRWKEHV